MRSKNLLLISLMSACALVACGGGGGSESTAQTEPLPVLSATQKTLEESILISNGGNHGIVTNWSSSGANLTTTAAYSAEINLSASPLGVTQGVMASYLPTIDLIASLPTSSSISEQNPNVGTAFIDNGQIAFISAKTPANYTYVGENVIVDRKAAGGQLFSKTMITGYTKVPLIGTIADTPQEVKDVNRPLAAYIKGTQTYQIGAAYYKSVGTRMGDLLTLRDNDNNTATDSQSATPVFTGTIEQYASAKPTELILTKGTIKTVKNARCWVNNTAGVENGSVGVTYYFQNLPTFNAVCEVSGKVYSATLQPDGAQLGTTYPTPSATAATPPLTRVAFNLRYNKAAIDSLAAALR